MSFINWGHETPEQKAFRKRLEEQALFQNAISRKIFEAREGISPASAASGSVGSGGNVLSKNQKLVEAISWGYWAPAGEGSDGDDFESFEHWTTDTFPAVSNVSRLVIFTGAGANAHLHSDDGDPYCDIKIELYDNSKDSWVRVWSKRLINYDDYYFDVDVDFPTIAEVTQIRLSSDPEQGQTYHSWSGATFDLYQFGEQSTDLQLVWADIENAPVLDPTSVSDWNDLFDTPYFTNVSVVGNIVNLTPSGLVQFRSNLFSPEKSGNEYLIEVIDNANCVTEVNSQALANCDLLTKAIFPACTNIYSEALFAQNLSTIDLSALVDLDSFGLSDMDSIASFNLPNLETAGQYAFAYCDNVTSISAPKLQSIGDGGFYGCNDLETVYAPLCTTLGDTVDINDNVFFDIDSKPFTLTVGAALATCNVGNPDGDIQYLVSEMAPDTVTINYV